MNNDYTFMKTGTGLLGDEITLDKDLKINIVALVSAFGEESLRNAVGYVKHSNRNIVTVEDIQRCLKYKVFTFLNTPNLQDKIDNYKKIIQDNNNYDFFDEDDNTIIEEETPDIFTESTCSCKICTDINYVHSHWDNWEPTTKLDSILKKNIDKIL